MGRLIGMIVPVIAFITLGIFFGSVMNRLFKGPEKDVDECKKDIKTNLILGWIFLALCIFTFSPLPYDPVPLKGYSIITGGFILLGISGYFLMYRHFRLQVLAVMALAKSLKDGKITKAQIMETLRVGEERADAIIKYLNRKNLVLTTSKGTIYKGIENEARERVLDELERKLRETPGTEDENCLRSLRELTKTLNVGSTLLSSLNDYSVAEIVSDVNELFNASVSSLEGSYELWRAAEAVPSPEKDDLLRKRDLIIKDVQESVKQLCKILSEIRSIKTTEDGHTELSRIREELNRNIEIAKRVEERMRAFQDIESIRE